MVNASDFRTGRHVVYALTVHLVFVPKYRRKIITAKVFDLLHSSWETVCQDFGCELRETGYEEDHVHLLVAFPPKVSISTLVNSLKGVSARMLRAAHLPEVEGKLWGEHFWSPSYCASSCGGASLDFVRGYVEKQRGETSSPA